MTSEVLLNPYFVRLYCTFLTTKLYKIGPYLGGGGGVRKENGGKKM